MGVAIEVYPHGGLGGRVFSLPGDADEFHTSVSTNRLAVVCLCEGNEAGNPQVLASPPHRPQDIVSIQILNNSGGE
jgi:hypothetical protein